VAPQPLAVSNDGKRIAARPGKPMDKASKPGLFDPSLIPPPTEPAEVYVFELEKLDEPALKLPEKMGVVTSLDFDARGQLLATVDETYQPITTVYDTVGKPIDSFSAPAPGQPPGFVPGAFYAHPEEGTWAVQSRSSTLYRLKTK